MIYTLHKIPFDYVREGRAGSVYNIVVPVGNNYSISNGVMQISMKSVCHIYIIELEVGE